MFGLDSRALKITWTVFAFCLLLAAVYMIRQTLILFAGAVFFAYMLSPVVGFLDRFLGNKRGLALAIVYVLFVGCLVAIGFALIPEIVSQASTFLKQLPSLVSNGRLAKLPLPHWLEPVREQIMSAANSQASSLQVNVMSYLQRAGTSILSGLGLALPLVLVPILAFFFLKDGKMIVRNMVGSLEEREDRTMLRRILNDVHSVLRNYIRALVILSLISLAVYALVLRLIGVQYELLLAGCAALLEFIPVIGPALALALILIVAVVTGSGSLLWILVFWGLYRLLQDYMLNPYLMKAGLEIHPLLVLFGVLAGDQIAGVAGMFFSVPVLAILKVIYINLKAAYGRHEVVAAA